MQGRGDAEGQHDGGVHLAVPWKDGRLAGLRQDRHHPRARGGELVEGGEIPVGPFRTEARAARVNQARPDTGEGIVVEPALLEQMVLKGSVAVDGVSLTIAGIGPDGFRVAAIPETLNRTTLGNAYTGGRVNVETDILVKIVRRQLEAILPPRQALTVERLQQMGF